MRTINVDVVIIGAGPAGSCAAAWLARHGHRVLITDRFRSPRARYSAMTPVGESLLGKTLPLFHDLGLREDFERRFLHKRGAVALWGRADRLQPLNLPPTGYSYQVHRPVFDTLLLKRAREFGATSLLGYQTTEVLRDGDRVTGIIAEGSDDELHISAQHVLDASGLGRVVARRLRLGKRHVGPRHWSVFGHVLGASRLGDPRHYDTITEATSQGWIWFIPLTDKRTSIGFVGLDRDKISGDLWADLMAEIARTRLVRPLAANSRPLGQPGSRSYRAEIVERLWGPGFALLGDAGGFVDPLLSTGVHVAVYSAYLAAACVDAVLKGTHSEEVAGSYYQRQLGQHLDRIAALIDTIYGGYAPDNQIRGSRDLHGMDADGLTSLEQRLGPLSMFILAPASEQLDLPDVLRQRIARYRPVQPRVRAWAAGQSVVRNQGLKVRADLIVKGARLGRGLVIEHPEKQFAPIEIADGALASRVWELLARPMTAAQITDALHAGSAPGSPLLDHVSTLLSVYAELGVVEPYLVADQGDAGTLRTVHGPGDDTKPPVDAAQAADMPGFALERTAKLQIMDSVYEEYRHRKLDTRHIHIARQTSHNALAIVLPTPQQDSTGVAHVLEHLVGWGSPRARGAHVFFAMMSRSLQTFLNAFTGPGWTLYTFCSPSAEDFLNLLDVHLESVFFPRFEQAIFDREAWHRMPGREPCISGIVHNEQKGAHASLDTIVELAVARALYPDTPHAHDHGGHPDRIPYLRLADAVAFHRRFYHPGQAWFYSHGEIPAEVIQRRIQAHLGERFAPAPRIAPPLQPAFTGPRQEIFGWPDAPADARTQVLVAWGARADLDTYERFVFCVFGAALTEGPSSPAGRALAASGLGRGLTPKAGIHSHYCQPSIWTGLRDVAPADIDAVERLVLEAVDSLRPDDVAAALDRIELRWHELDTEGLPHPLALLLECLGPMLYQGDALPWFEQSGLVARMRDDLSKRGFFEDARARHLLHNPHRARVVLEPHRPFAVARSAVPAPAEWNDERAPGQVSMPRDAPEPLDLPIASPASILAHRPVEPLRAVLDQRMGAHWAEIPINGIAYFDIRVEMGPVGPHSLQDAGLVIALLARHPADQERLQRDTGFRINGAPDGDAQTAWGHMHGRCLTRHLGEAERALAALSRGALPWTAATLAAAMDRLHTSISQALPRHAPRYAWMLAAAAFSPVAHLEHLLQGYGFLEFLRRRRAEPVHVVGDILGEVACSLVAEGWRNLAVASSVSDLRAWKDALTNAWAQGVQPIHARSHARPATADHGPAVALLTPTSVAHNAQVHPGVPYSHPDSPAFLVASHYLRIAHLHGEIREKGGAYGANASYEPRRGYLALWSFRDPEIAATYRIFDDSIRRTAEDRIDQDILRQAVLCAVKQVSRPETTAELLRSAVFDHIDGYTPALRRQYLEALVVVSAGDVTRVVQACLGAASRHRATIANESMILAANRHLPEPLAIVGSC